VHPMLNGLYREKKKRKKTFSFFFSPNRFFAYLDSKPWDFPIVFVLKYKQYLYVLVVCVLCRGKGQFPFLNSICVAVLFS
jgi:hypothetical protein